MRDHPLFSNRRNRGPARPEHTLVLLGFDNITALEDLFNEDIGTEVMDTAEARIAATVREADRVWRAGHRRIAVHAHGVNQAISSAFVARLQTAVSQEPIMTSHGPVSVTVAAGCAVTEEPDSDAPVAAARHALMEAMSSGIGCIRFAEETDAATRQRRDVANAARVAMGAIREGNLVNAYQPVVSAQGHPRAAFHECLVRVREPSGELITAAAFMPAMEQLGLATLIDRHVLVLALAALADDPGVRLSINIFPRTMQDAQWMMLFDEGTGRDPALAERLIVEVTETAAMLEPARTLAFMNRLRRKGCSFALDDFGMGHTSFGSLRDFRFDIIKIDGSFITDVTTNPDSRFFVEKLAEIGRHFDMMTVAEFVQSAADARILRDLGVEYFQGFYFGSPSLTLAPDLKPESDVVGRKVVGAG